MSEFENQYKPKEESEEKVSYFETIRNIALGELGPIDQISFSDAQAKVKEIGQEKNIPNPSLVVVVESTAGAFVLKDREAEAQWSALIETFEDDDEFPIPEAFAIDADQYYF